MNYHRGGGGHDQHGGLAWMNGMVEWHGLLAWMTDMDDWHG